jgi:nitrous oxidase accessory protein NosD
MTHRWFGVVLSALTLATATHATTLRVNPQTIGTLSERLVAEPGIREVVLEAGVYHAGVAVAPLPGVDAAQHPLLIRADDNAQVIFDGSHASGDLDKAAPVQGHAGVFALPYRLVGAECPKLWEPQRRIRYRQVADLAAVAAWPATYATDGEQLFFHAADGQTPTPGLILINHPHLDFGFFITRSHVTVRGIAFRNYLTRAKYSTAVQLRGDQGVIEQCSASNCSMGFTVVGHRNVVRGCRVDDCGGGIYVGGNDGVVEDCKTFKRADDYIIPMYEQDDSGIQFYHPATNGTLRGNVVQGFSRGITLKCEGVFLVEHNTLVDCRDAILRTVPQVGDRYVRNLVVGCLAPGMGGRTLRTGVVNDFNVYWDLGNVDEFVESMRAARLVGTGQNNVIADPRLVDRIGGDLRPAPGSICAAVSRSDRPVGALPLVSADDRDATPPVVRLELLTPAVESGAVGKVSFERDPWIGGGTTSLPGVVRPDPLADYDTAQRELSILVHADDARSQPSQMQVRIGEGEWQPAVAYTRALTLTLPDQAQVHAVSLRVADDAGNWSDPAKVRVRLANQAPALEGEVAAYANDHGLVLSFRSAAPAFASLEFSADSSYSQRVEEMQAVHRRWDANDGGDYVTRWREPRTLHHVGVLAPDVKTGVTYRCRIVLEDAAGHVTRQEVGAFRVAGQARVWTVSPTGADADAAGRAGQPVRTIQFALDRALPGDRVLVQSGIYEQEHLIRRGGVPGAPLTLEAAPGARVILDSNRRHLSLIRLDNVAHVVIANLTLRGYAQGGAGIYVADSSDVTIQGCTISNWLHGEGWPFGQGIFAHRSPRLTVRGNVLHRQENGLFLLVSPGAIVTHNTALKNLYRGMVLYFSCAGTRIVNNSIAYNQTEQIAMEDPDLSAVASMVCDYNNLATRIEPLEPGEVVRTTAVPEDRELRRGDASKAIIWAQGQRFRDFHAWQKALGKDTHSLFIDPRYVDASRGNFYLKPDSPNLRAGEGGATIGALGETP